MPESVGIMIAGLTGMTGSTAATGILAIAEGLLPATFGVTSNPDFAVRTLAYLSGWSVGGWDYDSRSLVEITSEYGLIDSVLTQPLRHSLSTIQPLPPIVGSLDAPRRPELTSEWPLAKTLAAGARQVANDIERFRDRTGSHVIIVVYVGSPPRVLPSPLTADINNHRGEFAGVHCYAAGALLSGAHFIDFTPSDALEQQVLLRMATDYRVVIAGRDGSTGQTMLKVHVGELLRRRNLHLDAWYSTNILGNNDGRVLGIPEHRVVKLIDKTAGLSRLLGYDTFDHVVDISYVKSHGDSKESWDVVECDGWLGSRVSLRMNWRSSDSLLAAPMILDLCRLVHLGQTAGVTGLQADLGFFFKNPLGANDVRPSQLYSKLLSWVDQRIADAKR